MKVMKWCIDMNDIKNQITSNNQLGVCGVFVNSSIVDEGFVVNTSLTGDSFQLDSIVLI
jgi:hypothetical protein